MSIFEDLGGFVVIHVPHSSTAIPEEYLEGLVVSQADFFEEVRRSADLFVDEIFEFAFGTTVVAPFSRLACDVERFLDDEKKTAAARGRGAVYTHAEDGRLIRKASPKMKSKAVKEIYEPHHQRLTEAVDEALAKCGRCFLIDGHSFSSDALGFPPSSLPSLCLGYDSFHAPPWLVEEAEAIAERCGLDVQHNHPYSGSIVPLKHLRQNSNVYSIMIEINKKIYLNEENYTKLDSFSTVKHIINCIISNMIYRLTL
ncbi:MAG: N-formylglutamate amidohydrolase [Deltaproteobacteria bacterium]|jgi:N-formylglutamate amidohydrolase|nr:N-formylglutamate amidohydrolase [Deltaproteobacteria bacterium]